MRTVAIYFTEPDFDDYPFDEDEYRRAYHTLAGLLQERGVRAAIVRDPATYLGKNTFQGGWIYDAGTFTRTEEQIEADMIFNRGKFSGTPLRIINDLTFNKFCDEKSATYAAFPALCPKSITVSTPQELEQALAAITSELVVLKPINGLGGEGIVIGDRDVIRKSTSPMPYIIQEFIDTSDGIEGIVDGMHDFRMVSINGSIVCVFVRQPCEGSYLANVSKGAKIWEVPVSAIPSPARDIFNAVDSTVEHYGPRVYCVDVARGADGRWTIIELNAQPGLSQKDYDGENDPLQKGEGSKRYFHQLADLLTSS